MIKPAKISSLVSLYPLPQYVVVLEDLEETRVVPIWIGASEGNAIALEMQGEKFPRPLTHDLLTSMIHQVGAKIEKVVVSDLKDSSYYALIYLQHDGKTIEMDARPSDSLALAVRAHCPIFIDQRVLDKCPLIEKPITEGEIHKFSQLLKTMTPEEFFKKLEDGPSAKEPEIGKGKGFDVSDDSEADDEDLDEEKD